MYIIWLMLAIIFLLVEIFTTALVSIWFIPGALIAALFSYLNISFGIQIIIFFLVSIACFPISKHFYDKRLKTSNKDTNENIIGKIGTVTTPVSTFDGRVLIGDVYWNAISEDEIIPNDTLVRITKINNLTVTVIPIKK